MKLLGCAMIFACCFLLGFVFSEREHGSLKACEEIFELAVRLESGVLKRIPIGEIILKYNAELFPRHLNGSTRREILDCLHTLKRISGCRECAEKCITLFTFVGRSSDASLSEIKCSETVDELREILAEKRRNEKNKSTLYPKLGAVLGILICIILI